MARRAYLFVYAEDLGTREELRDFLDGLPEVLNWRYDLPNAFYIVSESEASELAKKIRRIGDGRFVVTEIPENSDGLLPARSWAIVIHKVLPDGTSKSAVSQ